MLMDRCKIKRQGLAKFGIDELALVEPRYDSIKRWINWLEIYQFDKDSSEDDYSWLTCVLALKAVNSGNFGVGSILVDQIGNVISWGHNEVFRPYFRSDRHAEMVVMDKFEDAKKGTANLDNYTLYTSLESCPMCLARLITSRINRIAHVAEDITGGMVHKLRDLPTIWLDLAKSQVFNKAKCSKELVIASNQIFCINAEKLNEMLGKR